MMKLTRAASAAPTIGAIDCFMFAVWVGILTGIFEVAHLGIRHYSAGFVLRHSELLISMAPLSYTILFGTCGVALAVSHTQTTAPMPERLESVPRVLTRSQRFPVARSLR